MAKKRVDDFAVALVCPGAHRGIDIACVYVAGPFIGGDDVAELDLRFMVSENVGEKAERLQERGHSHAWVAVNV